MVHTNKVLEKLRRGEVAIGCQIRSCAPMIAEVYGACGFDYVFIEGEHFPYNIESVLHLVRACECGGLEPILRVVDHDPGKILQYLDMGVTGMIFPHCDSGAQAKEIMKAGKYTPQGERGFSNTSRATGYGTLPMDTYKEIANQNTIMMPMIESKESVDNLDEILAAGVDALHVGPGDLSESYGCPIASRTVQDALDLVVRKASLCGVPVGVPAATVDEAADFINRGFRLISFSSDLMLLRSICSASLKEIKQRTGQGGE